MSRRFSTAQTSALAPKRTGLIYRTHTMQCKAPVLDCTCDPDITIFPDVTREGYEAAMARHDARAARIRRGLS